MANRDAMPTRGPYEMTTGNILGGVGWPSAFFGTTADDPEGYEPCLMICSLDDTDCSFEEAEANATLIAAAFNSATAAADLGFDPIAAIEALPELLRVAETVHAGETDDPAVCNLGDYHKGLHCGLEDRDIIDRYEACDFGFKRGVERALEWVMGELDAALSAARKRGDA